MIERSPKLRVCHLGKYYPPARGGIETHVQGLARAQARLGASVQVLCVNHADEQGRDVSWRAFARTRTVRARDDDDVEVIRLGRQANVARLDVVARLPAALREVVDAGVDVLHLHVPNPTFLLAAAVLKQTHRVPLVITHHSDIVRQRVLRLAVRPLEELVYRRSAAILTTSPAYAQRSALLQAHASKVRVMPLGVDTRAWLSPDPAALARLRGRLGAGDGPLWLSVGRLVYYKGLETAVRALARVPGRWIVIGTGPEERSLRALSVELGVAGRIVWLGEVDSSELEAAFHLATALWFPSNARSEAFGLVQVEAMAAGCPVVNCSIDGSGVSWVAPDGEAALTVPHDDAAAFAAAASSLLGSGELRGRLAAGARRRARDFELEDIAARTLALYTEAVGAG